MTAAGPSAPHEHTTPQHVGTWRNPGRLTAIILCVAGACAALSIDVVRAGFGVKGDEATYVSTALSIAHDRDLAFGRKDLERFWSVYQRGPEGIFLKRGKRVDVATRGAWPFVRITRLPDRDDRLYYGKSFIYPLVAAPFAWLAGPNGLLLLHVILLSGVLLGAYTFLSARSPALVAWLLAVGFLFASVVPVYTVLLMPEVFNFSLVFFACFLWLYREVAPPGQGRWARWLRGPGADLAAAVLLGMATFSKPNHAVLIAPVVLHALWRRRFRHGAGVVALFLIVTLSLFGANAMVSGELNYQGGDRKTFYGRFPFDTPDATFDNRGIGVATDQVLADVLFDWRVFWRRLGNNVVYFVAGRHAGLIPYFFPGVAALILALWYGSLLRAWHYLILLTTGGVVFILLLWLPYTWAGGGGPSGNRYFMSFYPLLLFLVPPVRSIGWPLLSWVGGAVFTAHILINPFVSVARPWMAAQRGLTRWLPVEMTMINDLPVMLDQSRARVPYGQDPSLLLYFLDDNAWPPEPAGMWVAGDARTEIIARSVEALSAFRLTLHSPVRNRVRVSAGGSARAVDVDPGAVTIVTVPARDHLARQGHAYLISISTSHGFVPHLLDPASADGRFLGVQVELAGVTAGRER